jgi:phenylacetate-CoA ligase
MQAFDAVRLVEVLAAQWLAPEQVRALQDRKLRRLVDHAYAHVPYYRRLFDSAGLRPADIRGVGDLCRIPVSSKRQLAAVRWDDLLARNLDRRRCRESRSSGATGVPLSILHRRSDLTLTNLAFLRTFMAHGYRPWQRRVEFTGSRNAPAGHSWYEHLGLFRRRVLSDAGVPARWVDELRAWRPHVIIGYVMMLKQLALEIRKQGVTEIRPRLVFSTSGLLDAATRDALAAIFRAPVVDYYASEEARCIAWECGRCAGYHVNSDLLILQILDDQGAEVAPGVEGEITITNLHSFAMPFIRYRQGDMGTLALEGPLCGRGLPLLASVTGRSDDFIVAPDGRRLSPRLFYYALWTVPGVAEFRMIQQDVRHLRVELVVTGEYTDASRRTMLANIWDLLGGDVHVAEAIVDSIPRGRSEKLRSFVSLIGAAEG